MTTPLMEVEVVPAPRLNILALLFVLASVIATAAMIVAFPGKANAHPYDAPQIGDFVSGTFVCSGFINPMTGLLAAEFSATSQVRYNAEVKIVEYVNGVETTVTENLSAGVDGATFNSNVVPLFGTGGHAHLQQEVVLRVDYIRPSQEFGVLARWAPGGQFVLLAKWRGSDGASKCSNPAERYQTRLYGS